MTPKYTIEVDPKQDLVRIAMAGLFLPVHVAEFFDARARAHLELRCAPGRHVTLTDIIEMDSLPQETADAFTALLIDPQSRARRLAFVLPPKLLLRGQLWRILAGRDSRCFPERATAEAWLLEKDEVVVPDHLRLNAA